MTERIINKSSLQAYLSKIILSDRVRVKEINNTVTIEPVLEETRKPYSCPFLGIAVDSNLTVNRFLEWKQKERDAEHEKELRS